MHPIFALLESVTRQELARQVAYLKEENKILQARLPERLVATPQEKRRLLKFGRKLGVQLRDLISIVSYQTFVRWIREKESLHAEKKATSARKPGRPRTPDDIRELVLILARENSWGYTRILGELRKLGIKSVSRQTVKMNLKEHDIDPGPKRGKGSWDEFLKIHADTLWQCDFLSKPMWAAKGLIDVYLLVFLHLGSMHVRRLRRRIGQFQLRRPSVVCGGGVGGATERRRSGDRDRGQFRKVFHDRSWNCPRSRTIVRRHAALVEAVRLAPPSRCRVISNDLLSDVLNDL